MHLISQLAKMHHRNSRLVPGLALLGVLVLVEPVPAREGPAIAGWVETVSIEGIVLEAKLDTGAETSSLDARNITRFHRNGERWVRFQTSDRAASASASSRTVEAKIVRKARVKRAGATTERRPVVELRLCLGGVTIPAEFTLTDRSGLDYGALIGRAALGPRFAVDASRTNLFPASCKDGSQQ